jgi:hypothetical protein
MQAAACDFCCSVSTQWNAVLFVTVFVYINNLTRVDNLLPGGAAANGADRADV